VPKVSACFLGNYHFAEPQRGDGFDVRLGDRVGSLAVELFLVLRDCESAFRVKAEFVRARFTRWEHEHVLEAVQRRLDEHPEKMRHRRETVEHPFGTIKAGMGATHFLMKTLPRVAAETALRVLAYNLTRAMNIMGTKPLMAAMRA